MLNESDELDESGEPDKSDELGDLGVNNESDTGEVDILTYIIGRYFFFAYITVLYQN